ncbi:hypothetical protein, partial [Roseateles sp.]|uniref:hypothetical protein n=1 Tax=Roseateles sp. TaxID=1971397 RepID=UPI0031E04D78
RLLAQRPCQVPLNNLELEALTVLRHEKHPIGWIGVQPLGCSSSGRFFVARAAADVLAPGTGRGQPARYSDQAAA